MSKKKIKIITKTPLYGGLGGTSWLINGQYVYREVNQILDPFIDFENEYLCQKMASDANISVPLVDYNLKTGEKTTTFIPETVFLASPSQLNQIILVAKVIAKLHQLPIQGLKPFDFLKRINYYKQYLNIKITTSEEALVYRKIADLDEKYPPVFSHNDLVKGNLLFLNNRVYLIDFEYASLNSPLFDLASFLSENNLNSSEEIATLLSNYTLNDFPLEEIETYRLALDYLWMYWALARFKLTKNPVFETIYFEKKSRLKL